MKQAGLRLGAHMSIAGGTPLAVKRAVEAGCETLQIFVKNNNRWEGKALSDQEVHDFRLSRRRSSIRDVVAHAGYLINLASPRGDLRRKSIRSMVDELKRADRLSLGCLVVHPGSHMGEGVARGIERVCEAINQIHGTGEWKVPIALETTAGQGTNLGWQFEHLRDILAGLANPTRVRVCLDTCHIFAAGYEFRTKPSYMAMIRSFDRIIGRDKLVLFHLNDSKRELGSRVDRHEHIGKGKIGIEGFRWIMNDRRFKKIPKILETPKGKTNREDRRNLRVLRSLVE